ncbi:MAG: chromate efflux transporter [Nitrospirae bacterium]|nr:chromate efflux transporter [Nitrospirota bacterium]
MGNLFLSFLKLGLTAFGGPAMVAYIRGMSVDRHKWLDEEQFKDGVALCQTIPGATAMQTAAYVGLRARGIAGSLASFIGFGLPAFILMMILSFLYQKYHQVSKIVSLFNGLQVVVVAIVVHATYSFGKTAFKNYKDVLLASTAAIALGTGVSPFIVIFGAALIGILSLNGEAIIPATAFERETDCNSVKQLSVILFILILGLLMLYLSDTKIFSLAVLMMRIDLFAFGGGFASLPLMLHEIVEVRGWIDNKTFMDGIALGQVTPGPIVITSTFVGYLTHGITGAFVSTVAIFTPSLLMVIAITPVMDRLKAYSYFLKAANGILASFVGLLFFVAVKFAIAVHWDIIRVLLCCVSFAALYRKVDIVYIVLITAVVSIFIF